MATAALWLVLSSSKGVLKVGAGMQVRGLPFPHPSPDKSNCNSSWGKPCLKKVKELVELTLMHRACFSAAFKAQKKQSLFFYVQGGALVCLRNKWVFSFEGRFSILCHRGASACVNNFLFGNGAWALPLKRGLKSSLSAGKLTDAYKKP